MTDGERLVWAASFAIAFDRGRDAINAATSAARAVEHLREAAVRRLPTGDFALAHGDTRDFLDEIVSVP